MTNENRARRDAGANGGNNGGMNQKDWRNLCQMVASEPDAHRLSELVDDLLNELDRRKDDGNAADDQQN
jgi:hypothetical protein